MRLRSKATFADLRTPPRGPDRAAKTSPAHPHFSRQPTKRKRASLSNTAQKSVAKPPVKSGQADLPSGRFHGRIRMNPPVAANDNTKPVKLLRYCELNDTRGITYTRRHLYTLENERKFPKRVPLGENRVGWIESEIDNWLAEKAASRAA
jgi:prophage regulatory protein